MPKGAFDEANDFVQTEKTKPAEQSAAVTVIKGVIGAFIGTIPSAVLWIAMGKIGYISEMCGFFMIFGEMYICSLMTKKSSDMNIETAIVICIIVTLIMVYVCERAVWSWDIRDAFGSGELSVGYCFLHFESLIGDTELSSDFDAELIKSYAIAALGATTHVVKTINWKP